MLLTPYYMGDTHKVVIDYAGEVICREAIAFNNNKIAKFCCIETDLAADNVIDDNDSFWHRESNCNGLALGFRFFDFRFGRKYRGPLIYEAFFFLLGLLAEFFKLFARLKTIIRPAHIEKLPDVFIVSFSSLRLEIWAVWTIDFRPFVPGYPKPFQVIDNLLSGGRCIAFEVGILDAQDEFTACFLSQKPVEQCCSCSAYMKVSRRRRGKTCYDSW